MQFQCNCVAVLMRHRGSNGHNGQNDAYFVYCMDTMDAVIRCGQFRSCLWFFNNRNINSPFFHSFAKIIFHQIGKRFQHFLSLLAYRRYLDLVPFHNTKHSDRDEAFC